MNEEIVIIIYDEVCLTDNIQEQFYVDGMKYKLIYVAETITNSGGDWKWDGQIYCRHGGDNHTSWWIQNRLIQMFLELNGQINDYLVMGDLDLCVYVQEKKRHVQYKK